ncbi:MAG: prepilin-type N-terminal cleavage/methylation domain-containing protein [Actinobacteria bacterium]|nr:prepilin-type N-terminal cleavage/methylation domain-containing protein [Actinomycetota bacterium]
MRRLFDRAERDERGFTITEVTLTLLILSIVLMVAFDFLDRASILTMRADAHGRAEAEVQTAMRVVSQNVRSASPVGEPCTSTTDTPPAGESALPAGYADCMQFTVRRTTTALDTCARTEFLYALVPVSGSTTRKLVENRREYTGTTASCTQGPLRQRRVLLERVANTTPAQPLFAYYGSDGAAIPTSDTAAIKKASSVRMTLAVRFQQSADPIVLTSSAALRNIR